MCRVQIGEKRNIFGVSALQNLSILINTGHFEIRFFIASKDESLGVFGWLLLEFCSLIRYEDACGKGLCSIKYVLLAIILGASTGLVCPNRLQSLYQFLRLSKLLFFDTSPYWLEFVISINNLPRIIVLKSIIP